MPIKRIIRFQIQITDYVKPDIGHLCKPYLTCKLGFAEPFLGPDFLGAAFLVVVFLATVFFATAGFLALAGAFSD